MKSYLNQLRFILENGITRADRTGVGTISTFGLQTRFNMQDGFPAVTTKKLAWKVIVSELMWFISGSNNIADLKSIYRHNKIWDANYQEYLSRLGKNRTMVIWGKYMVFNGDAGRTLRGRIDQLQNAIDLIRETQL